MSTGITSRKRDTILSCFAPILWEGPDPCLTTEVQSPLDAARKLAPTIRSYAEEIEATRELPRPLFEALADAGMFHLALPRTLGCPELDLPTYIQVIEELGKADASTAWAINQGAIFATYASRMPSSARAIWIDTPRRCLQHPHPERSGGRGAGRVPGHGRAGFQHGLPACLLGGPAQIMSSHPRRLDNGQPETRYYSCRSPRPSCLIPGTSGVCAAQGRTTSPSMMSSCPRSAAC